MSKENNPSQTEVNKVLRVLAGERRKYTVTVHQPNKAPIEFQSDSTPTMKWDEEMRQYVVQCKAKSEDYSGNFYTVMALGLDPSNVVILTEANPDAPK